MIKTSVIILNWNGKQLLEQFLPSVLKHSLGAGCRVFVADNGSTDDSIAFMNRDYPDVPLILFDQNYGFAEGYNKAIQQADSEFVVLLNSDVETTENWLDVLINYMEFHPEVAAVQPKICSYNNKKQFEYAGAAGGFIDRYGYPFCRGRILEVVEEDQGQYDTVIPVFWATGACLCVRRKDYLDAGGLDPRFFAHMEEIDLCWRLHARDRGVMCLPSSVVYHVGGASLSKENPKKMYLNFRNNLLMIYKNVSKSDYATIFLVRCLFDFLAYVHLVLKGKFQNAHAIVEAYLDFLKMRRSYKAIRRENLKKTTVLRVRTQYRKSILLQFYLYGRKTYQSVYSK